MSEVAQVTPDGGPDTALPLNPDPAGGGADGDRDRGPRIRSAIGQGGLVFATIAVAVFFSAIHPNTYFTVSNFGAMLGSQAVLVVLTMAMIVPLRAGDTDLSTASVLLFTANIIAILTVREGIDVLVAVPLAMVLGVLVGFINGIIAVYYRIDSFIVTLGTGTFLQGLTLFMTGGLTTSGVPDSLVDWVVGTRFMNVPLAFFYGLALVTVTWFVFEHTPIGVRLLFVGKSRRVAELNGISVSRTRIGALMASGLISSLAGIMYVGTLGSADPASAVSYLLPAFAAAFLGGTAIRPGRFNAWGSFVAVYFLVFGITGLLVSGAATWVQPVFYGGALVIAVMLSQALSGRGKSLTMMGGS